MSNHVRILSFDEARAVRHRKRAQASAVSRQRQARSRHDNPLFEQDERTGDLDRAAPLNSNSSSRRAGRSSAASRRSTAAPRRSTAASRRTRKGAVAKETKATRAQTESDEQKRGRRKGGRASFVDKLRERKRARVKERAGKQFSRQFAASASHASPEEPRAAVYKGEMGTSHKRAFRMQREGGSAQGKSAGSGAASMLGAAITKLVSLRRVSVSLGIVICLVLVCAFLYTPAQQYYHAIRKHDQALAELTAVQERNSELAETIAYLETEAGVEALARDELGWVEEDEVSVYVQGLEGSSDDDTETTSTTGNIQPGSIEAPVTWYSSILDVIFGEG